MNFGAGCIDIYLVAYVAEQYKTGKQAFYEYVLKNGITDKKKECGFTPEYRAFSNVEKAQLFIDSIARNGQTEKMKQKAKPEVTANKGEKITKNKNIIQKNNESKKMKDILIPSILQTPLVKQISEEFVHLYVDGSFDRHNKIGGGGIVFVKNNQILIRDFFQCTSDTTKSLSSVAMERLTVKKSNRISDC